MLAARATAVRAAASPAVAATLSFVLPGLGQVSLGDLGRGAVLAAPACAVFLGAVALIAAGRSEAVAILLRPEVLITLLVLNVVLAAYHLAAIVDAYRLAWGRRRPAARRLGRASGGPCRTRCPIPRPAPDRKGQPVDDDQAVRGQ